MLPRDIIDAVGGKGALVDHMHTELPKLPIPDYVLHAYDREFEYLARASDRLKKPQILRSSSPFEYENFEGIFDSVPNIYDNDDLARAYLAIQESATSPRAQAYAQAHGIELTERIHFILQEQSPATYWGAMMRHPNDPNMILINYYDLRIDHGLVQKGRYNQKAFLYNTSTKRYQENHAIDRHGEGPTTNHERRDLEQAIGAFEEVETLPDITDDKVLVMEFGLNPFDLYQIRPFLKKETATFELPEPTGDYIHFDMAFGVTPSEGVVIPVLKGIGLGHADGYPEVLRTTHEDTLFEGSDLTFGMDLYNANRINKWWEIADKCLELLVERYTELSHEFRNGYFLLTTDLRRDVANYDLDLVAPHMQGLAFDTGKHFLVHGVQRAMKQAGVSVITESVLNRTLYKKLCSGNMVRFTSNGRGAILEPA